VKRPLKMKINRELNTIKKKKWTEIIIPKYKYKPHACPTCLTGDFVIKESNGNDILNPYYLRCNNKPYRRRKNLRAYTFFALHKKYTS